MTRHVSQFARVLALSALFVPPSYAAPITFDLVGATTVTSFYQEAGFDVAWIGGDGRIINGASPWNGSFYAQAVPSNESWGPTIRITRTGGGAFTFTSFDGAEGPSSATGIFVQGVRVDNSSYMETFGLDGIHDGAGGLPDFQTFHPTTSVIDVFTELSFTGFLDPPNGIDFSIDNVLLAPTEVEGPVVPEPTSLLLLGSGIAALARRRASRRSA